MTLAEVRTTTPPPPSTRAVPRGTIVIPAHDEEAVILRTLHAVQPLLENGLAEVVVACNGCTDRTAELAASVAGVRVIETDVPMKTAALNAADATASHWPRLYLDADIEISPEAALEVLDTVARGEALAARPEFRYVTDSASALVRSYYRARDRLPGTRSGLWGAGAFALGAEGHARFGTFPAVTADDLFVDRQFRASEKRSVPTTPVPVHTPRRARSLMAVLRRQSRGSGELALGPATTTRSTARALLGSIRGPASAFDAVVYAVLSAASRRPGRGRRSGRSDRAWERDDSARIVRTATPLAAWRPPTIDRTPHEPAAAVAPVRTPAFAGPDERVDVAAIIVTYESRECIDGILDSLRAETAGHSIRAIVADNASCDGTLSRVLGRHPDVFAIGTGGNLGYAGAINIASALVGAARAILILNPDAVIEPGSVGAMLDRLDRSGAGAVVPRIRSGDGSVSPSIRREPTLLATLGDALCGARMRGRPGRLSETVFEASAYRHPHPIEWATGAALMVDAKLADRIGPWDERYFLFSEETDYLRRLRTAGASVWYEPAAEVTHLQGASGFSPRLNALSAVNRIRYAQKFRSPRYAAAFRAITVLAEALRLGRPQNAGTLGVVLSTARWSELPHAPGHGAPAPNVPSSGTTFGYLVPEFPGQTHAFFWREITALRHLGATPHLISTRKPPRALRTHAWAEAAAAEAQYLFPGSPGVVLSAAALLLSTAVRGRAGPLFREIEQAHSTSHESRARLIGLGLAGAELAVVARRGGWCHVHVHSCADSAWVALFAHLLTGLRYSLTAHGPLGDYGGGQDAKWSHAGFGLAITTRLRDEIEAELEGNVPPDLAIAPMGIDPEHFMRRLPYRPWTAGTTARILSCGRLNPSKGHDDLVRALALLVAEGRDVELVIAGEDDDGGTGYRQWLEAFIAASGVADRVILLGAVSEDAVRAELGRAHVFALASHAEPLGVAIMEAMAMSVPVVVTAEGGVRELVEDRVTGILANAHAPWTFATEIAHLLDRPEIAIGLGLRARDHVSRRFNSARSAATLLHLVEESTHEDDPRDAEQERES
ncbi:exopolysaccharide biosynthesis GT4 family glycosyltransferase EpsE [Agromyces ramosus]|uniref:GT2 family glycosyltransferase n=1 Tax=Agromyces ramosus TaxID=33879 RepID=A0ABU0R943_9MICO|nr:exopolysaccharide biosynthesis GT4 family glycosyltransferase EpsE [Agromyces ramosus]MDQ0894282.1 GT2 family glycosyltransferase [Agromyces ramosus]